MRITEYLKGKVSKNEKIKIEYFCKMMYLNENIPNSFEVSKKSLIMWKENRKFFEKDENCVLVTANMSAGKSTLINAIIGKKLALTKNESCTDEIKKYFNKTFEDNRLIKINQEGKIKIIDSKNRDDIESVKEVYTYMNLNVRDNPKLVIIDTPGVNSSIDIDHKYITKKMLESKEYNKVIYVINATNIGSYDDYIHLNEVYKNLNGREIIFVLNKLDMFRSRDDSIDETIYELKKQLEKIGFINPMICPTSAYAAGIFKKLIFSKLEDEDEEDECRRLLRKFSREAFDLNKYYPNKCNFEIKNKKITFDDYSTDEIIECFKRTGIINIQNLITKRFDKSKEVSIEHNPYKVETKITINEKKVVENNELSYGDMKKLNALMKMREVFIKYNPYKVETKITIDGKKVAENSELNVGEKRLQEWIEDFPRMLTEECNSKSFKITFHGTILDYEDLVDSFEKFIDKNKSEDLKKEITFEYEHIPAKEVKDKEEQIKQIFREIQDGPFEELKKPDLKKAFELASKSEFEVNVVATMSAGKSTLINALLAKKLMPSKNEACTATITRIKDTSETVFTAIAKDSDGEIIKYLNKLSYEDMKKLNDDKNVSSIEVEGDIPFINNNEMSLVLVDTPGPNNSRDESHKEATFKMLSESSKTLVLYILNGTQFAVNDDNNLLNNVAKSMSVGGKQSKDRFIFVVNKLDGFKSGEDNIEETLIKVKEYLEGKGIKNPNVFPASALTALDIRTVIKQGEDIDEDLLVDVEYGIKKFNKREIMHFEKYSNLTPSIEEKINRELEKAELDNDKEGQALIHTGIRSIEEYINMYVEKYAKTAKIKNIVDTFEKKLEEENTFESAKQNIVQNEEEKERVLAQIQGIQAKIDSAENINQFEKKLDAINFDKEIEREIKDLTAESQKRVSAIQEQADKKINRAIAEMKIKEYTTFIGQLQAEVKVKIENIVNKNIKNNANALMNEYIMNLNALSEDIPIGNLKFRVLDLVIGKVDKLKNIEKLLNQSTKTERVEEEVWIENTNKKWYKPWTWLQDEGEYITRYKDVEYVDGIDLAEIMFAPVEKALIETNKEAIKHAQDESICIKNQFKHEFKKINEIIKLKLEELKVCASNKELTEKNLKESKERLLWLQDIQNKVKEILDI